MIVHEATDIDIASERSCRLFGGPAVDELLHTLALQTRGQPLNGQAHGDAHSFQTRSLARVQGTRTPM